MAQRVSPLILEFRKKKLVRGKLNSVRVIIGGERGKERGGVCRGEEREFLKEFAKWSLSPACRRGAAQY